MFAKIHFFLLLSKLVDHFFVYLHHKWLFKIVMHYDVTIGIPVYRAVDFIEKTMESALNQTFESIEFLIVDDCGNDGSMDIVKAIKAEHPRGKDIRILCNEKNCGVGYTRNRILNEASGQYLYFLDSDDIMEPDTIQLMTGKMYQYGADVVYGSLERIDLVGQSPDRLMILPNRCIESEGEMALYAFRNYNSFQISACNCLMSISFLRVNHLSFIDTLFWEDLAFTYDMVAKVKRAVLLSEVTYHYQCRSGSLSHYQKRDRYEKSEIQENVSTINYMKGKCRDLIGMGYIPYLCYNLEMNSFYIICHILKNRHRIIPCITYHEMNAILHHPMKLCEILQFKNKLFPNLLLWTISILPPFFSIPIIWCAGRLKGVI